jgi:hypothetical protein
MSDTLRDTLFAAIEEQYADQLAARIEQVQHEHQLRVEATLDKALAAIAGEKPAKVKAKAPRKPRADKGRKRMGRGMPERPTEAPSVAQEPEEPSGPSCAACEHFHVYHEADDGPCTLPGCGCEGFVGESEVEGL